MSYITATRQGIIDIFYNQLGVDPHNSAIEALMMYESLDDPNTKVVEMDAVPSLQRFTGLLKPKILAARKIDLISEPYGAPYVIPNSIYEAASRQGAVARAIQSTAADAAQHPWKLMHDLLALGSGAGPTGIDGVAMFSASHPAPEGGSVQSNLLTASDISSLNTASTTVPTAEEVAVFLPQAIALMQGYKDPAGRPINEGASQWMAVTPASMASGFRTAINANLLGGSTSSAVKAQMDAGIFNIRHEVSARLTSTAWYLFNISYPDVRPFILAEFLPPTIDVLGPGTEEYAKAKGALILPDWHGGIGVGAPLTAAKLTLS